MYWDFDDYRLDTENVRLLKAGEPVALRPKTFDVLRYLVEHAGELVRKETLLDEVWKNSYVVEGVLTTSMSELRKLFGDTAKNQRYIATVYRRGYRFIAEVRSDEAVPAEPFPQSSNRSRGTIRKFPQRRGFVGREQESARLVRLLAEDPDCRILTLVGPGGIGKTRLALAVVKRLSEYQKHPFEDGFYAVALQSLDSDDDIHLAIADSLGLQCSGDVEPRQQIQGYLENRKLLLLLDNFEQMVKQGPALSDIMQVAPGVKILLTSRQSLPVSEAWFHPVAGLEYDGGAGADAIRLFTQIARRNQPGFDLNENLPLVSRICRMVEGMPLALELAASWLKMLDIEEVADEIARGIDILTDQQGAQDERHHSVRAVFIETWQRMTESERTLLKQLSVFRGGADRVAINAVIGAGLPLLAQLVNKSLLGSTQKSRYRMHELIRQFAEEELIADADVERQARQGHADFYLGWLGQQFTRLRSNDQGDACRGIQADFGNIRHAWRWAVEQGQIDLVSPAIRALSLFCDLRGHFLDGLAMFELLQQKVESSDHPDREGLLEQIRVRSAILNFRLSRYDTALSLFLPVLENSKSDYERALILRFLGDYRFSHAGHCSAEQVKAYLSESIVLCQQLGETQLQTECLCEFAILYANLDINVEASQRYATQAVTLARRDGRPDLLAIALDVLAWTTNHRGDYAAAEAIWREVFDIAYNSGNRSNEALATNWLGWSAWSVGGARHDEAIQYFANALQRYRELGDRANQSMTCADIATVMMENREMDSARDYCLQGLKLAREIGREDHLVYNLYVLGAVDTADGNLQDAREHLTRALEGAWEQEEETNKPVVLFYIAQLFYAEYCDRPDADRLSEIGSLLLFVQLSPSSWQAFKDRAKALLDRIEAETGRDAAASIREQAEEEIIESVLSRVPVLMQ